MDITIARNQLDDLIRKSRIHFYKPIQIAEILYHSRTFNDLVITDLNTYRTKSKKWRDDVTKTLLHCVCTSSSRFQDNLFDPDGGISIAALTQLDIQNKQNPGVVERYIYDRFFAKHDSIKGLRDYCQNTPSKKFSVSYLIDIVWKTPGLKRSMDKVYEIVVYALFSTLVEALDLRVELALYQHDPGLLKEFDSFAKKILNLELNQKSFSQVAKVYRVGVTNAADRGLDLYSNWGPAIQIKHLTLDVTLAKDIISSIDSDRVVIVCRDTEKDIIECLLNQIGWAGRIQSIVTESDLVDWYEKAMRGIYRDTLGDSVLRTLSREFNREFPALNVPQTILSRNYNAIANPWELA